MKTWPIWKRIQLLWVLMAIAGIVTIIASVLPSLAIVHYRSRTSTRLVELGKMPDHAQVPAGSLREATQDAATMADITNTGMIPVLIPAVVTVLLAWGGSKLNKKIRQMEENAQPAGGAYVAPEAGAPSAHP